MIDFAIPLILILTGLIFIFKAAEKSIENAVELARTLGISELTIGFILVSTATSLPEFFVSITAALKGSSDLSVGNVFGANISDILFVLGVAAVLGATAIKRKDLKELVLIMLATSAISLLFVIYNPGRISGIILLVIFAFYIRWMLQKDISDRKQKPARKGKLFEPFAKFALFISIVILGSQLVVENAIKLSFLLGITQTVIGATLVSIGTTLPELSVSISAIRKKAEKMAIGNAVGSSIVNLTLVFGASLAINPQISFAPAIKLIIFSVLANLLLLYFVIVKGKLTKRDGFVLIGAYALFLIVFATGNM
ncbi:sodium:calcium antiporter [Candidatus Micrarchaeota archaeon]|nr:sodium:calcium antiporter [Candidatus Micrarchaeota archaeon]